MALILEIDASQANIDKGGVRDLRCRACLSINRQLYLLTNDTELREVFLKICIFYEELPLNVYLCWECVSILRKLVLFKNKVQYAESVLRSQLCDEKSLSSLCFSRVINTDTSIPIGKDEELLVETKPCKIEIVIKDERYTPDTTVDHELQIDNYYDKILDLEHKDGTEKELKDIQEEKGKTKKQMNRYIGLRRMVRRVRLTEEEISEWMEMERNSKIFKKLENKLCDLCLCRLGKKITLETHLKLDHQRSTMRPMQCNFCKQYLSVRNLPLHLKSHTGRVCLKCGYKCCTYYNMVRHIDAEHRAPGQCLDCDAKCGTRKEYLAHYKEYHWKFKCNDCHFRTRRKKILIEHIRRGHSVNRCEECNKEFRYLCTYKRHIKEAHVDRTGEAFCVQCNIQFNNVTSLKKHVTSSNSHKSQNGLITDMNFSCTECPKVYKSKFTLKNHVLQMHKASTKYYCVPCNKNFVCKQTIKKHNLDIHENAVAPRAKYCDACGKGFLTKRDLANHIRIHTRVRQYECPMCDAKFSLPSTRKRHIMNKHKETSDDSSPSRLVISKLRNKRIKGNNTLY